MKDKILECKSLSDVCKLCGYSVNGVGLKKAIEFLKIYDISVDLFNMRKKYEKSPNYCKYCGNIIIYEKKNNIFCNNKCSASYNNLGKLKSTETKKKISLKILEYNEKKNIEYVDKICPNCEKIFKVRDIYREKIKKYCSPKCYLDALKNKSSVTPEEYNLNICHNCHKEFIVLNTYKEKRRKYCCYDCRLEAMKRNLSLVMKERVKNGLHTGWKTRNIESYPEKFFKSVLENNNLDKKYKFNFPYGGYFLDFYFEEKKIDLEIDGKQHEYDDRKESDINRDIYLKENNIIPYRIKWKSINNEKGKLYMKNEIDKFIFFYNSK